MTYGKEDTDYRTDGNASSGYIFNGADSVFWRRIRLLMDSELRAMYQTLDSSNCWSSDSLINEYDRWQAQFPEELWRLDIERKYYRTYRGEGLNAGATPSPTKRYLQEMMNGRKKYQRRQFERDQAAYMGTKYLSSTIMADKIEFRCNTPINAIVSPNYDLTIIPYSDMYLSVKFGNTSPVQIRAKAGTSYTVKCPIDGTMDDTMFIIYCASRIQALNDISACYIHDNDFSSAKKLQTLIIGNTTVGYSNEFLTTLNLGNSPLLESLDIRNCPNLTGSLNLSSCVNLITLRAEGTALAAVTFANYGKIATAHLPSTVNTLSMRNLYHLTDLDMTYNNLESLTIENSDVDDYGIVLSAANTLQFLRLVGIDWTLSDTTLLNKILAMNSSYLAGEAYISGSVRNQELLNYSNAWNDLEVTYNSQNLITQYLATYVNADGTELYSAYVDRGATPPDPVTLGLIQTPTRESTAQYTFAYSGWDDIESAMLAARTITAEYTSTIRTYTVRWYSRAGLLLETQTANYGSEVNYSGSTPTNTSEEAAYIYNVFAGWDKSTGYITGDTDVYAVWDRASLPAIGTELEDMSCAQIFAVCTAGLASSYFVDKDHFDIQLGSDFTFSNVRSTTLLENRFFNGVDDYYDTDIQLFNEDAPSFTIAIDYELMTSNSSGNTLIACYEENGNEGFRLRYNGSYANIVWGDRNMNVGYGGNRNVCVLRHVKGSKSLFVYGFNASDTTYDLTLSAAELVRTRDTLSNQVLSFGAARFIGDGGHDYFAKGWVHWCKIWYEDLGATNAAKLCSWPHETLRMEFTGANRYRLSGETSVRANASFLACNPLSLLRRMNPSNTNAGGWNACEMRTFLATRVFDALSYEWQSCIKQVKILATAGSQSYEIITSNDKIYLPSHTEVGGSTSSPYSDEGSPISFYTSNAKRVKIPGWIISETAQIISEASDPTAMVSYNVSEGDIWLNTSNSSVGYVYLSSATVAKHSKLGWRLLSNGDNRTAADGGLWVCAYYWWGRSPLVSSSANFLNVYASGYPGSYIGASGTLGVVPGFSI